MDLANNQKGIFAAQSLLENKTFSPEKLLEEFRKALEEGRIVVLKPRKKGDKP